MPSSRSSNACHWQDQGKRGSRILQWEAAVCEKVSSRQVIPAALADEAAVRRTAATTEHRTMLCLSENIVTPRRKADGPLVRVRVSV